VLSETTRCNTLQHITTHCDTLHHTTTQYRGDIVLSENWPGPLATGGFDFEETSIHRIGVFCFFRFQSI